MVLNCFLGKTRLWHGQPFLARTWFDLSDSDFLDRPQFNSERLLPYAIFRPVEPTEIDSAGSIYSTFGGLPDDILVIDTLVLNPGVYEVTIGRGDQTICSSELLWLLTKDDYASLVSYEFAEQPAAEPLVTRDEDLRRFLNAIMRTRWPEANLRIQVLYRARSPFPISKYESMIATVLDNFKYLSVFSRADAGTATLSVGDESFEFGIEASIEYLPAYFGIEKSLNDPQCSDLLLMQYANADRGEGLDFGVTIDYGKAAIRIQHAMPQLEYA